MIELDRRYGPFPGRVWGLIVNLFANALALYGFAGYLRGGTHLQHLVIVGKGVWNVPSLSSTLQVLLKDVAGRDDLDTLEISDHAAVRLSDPTGTDQA